MLEIRDLSPTHLAEVETRLQNYDEAHIKTRLEGAISIGVYQDGEMIAGADACITAHRILYVSTVFVDENHRRQGIGRMLMADVEKRARALGANLIRLDTFDWQGKEFYQSIGYEIVGQYDCPQDEFSEYFFLKRLT